jgi:hypothetical protein
VAVVPVVPAPTPGPPVAVLVALLLMPLLVPTVPTHREVVMHVAYPISWNHFVDSVLPRTGGSPPQIQSRYQLCEHDGAELEIVDRSANQIPFSATVRNR